MEKKEGCWETEAERSVAAQGNDIGTPPTRGCFPVDSDLYRGIEGIHPVSPAQSVSWRGPYDRFGNNTGDVSGSARPLDTRSRSHTASINILL